MKPFKRAVPIALLFCCGFSCKVSGLIRSLNVVSDSASLAVMVTSGLQAAGVIPADIASQVVQYAGAVGAACDKSVTELNSADTIEQKIVNVTSLFSAIPPPNVQGRAAQVVAIVRTITSAIELFLHQLNPATVSAMNAQTAGKATAAGAPIEIRLTTGDHAQLRRIQRTSRETIAAAASWKAK